MMIILICQKARLPYSTSNPPNKYTKKRKRRKILFVVSQKEQVLCFAVSVRAARYRVVPNRNTPEKVNYNT